MFSFLKNIGARLTAVFAYPSVASSALPSPGAPPAVATSTYQPNGLAAHPEGVRPNGLARKGNPQSVNHHHGGHQNSNSPNGAPQPGSGVPVSLRAILGLLPSDLQLRIQPSEVGNQTISIGLAGILPQLTKGAIQIPFGELRQAAPHVFSPENDRDHVLVTLPLEEILPKLSPALMMRRRSQKQVEVPEEIQSPFDPRGQTLVFSVGPSSSMAPVAPSHSPPALPVPAAAAEGLSSPPTAPLAGRHGMASSPTPPPPPGPESPAPTLIPFGRGRPEWSAQPPAPEEIPQCRAEEALRTIPAPRPELAPASELTDALTFNLASLAETWPEAMRKELSELKLSQAKVSLPLSFVEQGLKAGKITVSWKHLRGWIKPPPMPVVSLRDDLALELPLKLLAPVFLARSKGSGSPRAKVAVDESIPNLFFGFPQKEPSAPPGVRAASADTNYFTRGDKGVVVANPDGTDASPTPGTRFVAKYATPNEVVSRAAGLEHVAGALIALPDGLLVASRLDAELNAETVAAFLPQIFAKVSQCTRELRMGDLNNLNFTVGDVPWKIFRVNAIYFAAVGRSKEPLPTAQLAALAAELDHRPKA